VPVNTINAATGNKCCHNKQYNSRIRNECFDPVVAGTCYCQKDKKDFDVNRINACLKVLGKISLGPVASSNVG